MTSELTELQKRLPSLTLKAKKHSRRVISSLSYPDTVTGLGEFTGREQSLFHGEGQFLLFHSKKSVFHLFY